ncbi:hypothetical protein FRC10_008414 [Ceratobasidium sp. 414]|nr:hypothetical protein FRC10_008414 [Ceratobasidium sp. 414]
MSEEGSGLAAQLEAHSKTDILMIVGTSLKTSGAFKLVKRMAQETHFSNGVVVYINNQPAAKQVASFVDMHLLLDIEVFSTSMLRAMGHRTYLTYENIRDRITRLGYRIASARSEPAAIDFTQSNQEGGASKEGLVLLFLHKPGMEEEAKDLMNMLSPTLVSRNTPFKVLIQATGSFENLPQTNLEQ